MILDSRVEFADATSVAAVAGTALIGNVVDLETARDIGSGEPLYFVVTIDTAVITGGSAGTITLKLASDAQAAIATDGSATVHYASKAFVTDDTGEDLTAGLTAVVVAVPWEGAVYERYLGVLATIATTTVTAGKINAFLTKDPAKWKSYDAPGQA